METDREPAPVTSPAGASNGAETSTALALIPVAGGEGVPEQSPGLDRLGRRRHHAQFKPGQSGNPFGRRGKPKPPAPPPPVASPSPARLEVELADHLWGWGTTPGVCSERPGVLVRRRLTELFRQANWEAKDRANHRLYSLLAELLAGFKVSIPAK